MHDHDHTPNGTVLLDVALGAVYDDLECRDRPLASPQPYTDLEEAEAASEAVLESHRRRPELTGDDLPVPDDYAGLLPMAGDRW